MDGGAPGGWVPVGLGELDCAEQAEWDLVVEEEVVVEEVVVVVEADWEWFPR